MYLFFFTLFLIHASLLSSVAQAQQSFFPQSDAQVVHIDASFDKTDLRTALEILQDFDNFSIFEVMLPSTPFVPLRNAPLELGNRPYWLRFHIKMNTTAPTTLLLELDALLADHVELYRASRPLEPLVSGYLVELSKRPYPDRRILFPLPFAGKEEEWIYAKVSQRVFQSYNAHLYSQAFFSQTNASLNLVNGVYFGGVIALILFNSFLFFWLRNKIYVCYIGYVFCLPLVLIALRLGYWGEIFGPRKSDYFLFYLAVFIGFLVLNIFTIEFLKLKEHFPKIHKIIFCVSFILLIQVFHTVFPNVIPDLVWLNSVAAVISIGVSAWCAGVLAKKGSQPAALYFLGCFMLLAAAVAGIVSDRTSIAGIPPSNLIFQLGVVFEALLFSFAMALNFQREREKTFQQLNIASRNAEDASQAKSAFLRNISHELRTPLTAILGFSEILSQGGNSTSEVPEFGSIIQRNSISLLKIVDDLLDMSRIEAGRAHLVFSEFSLRTLVAQVLASFELLAREKSLHLASHFANDIPDDLTSDAVRITQILVNLVGNALKFTDQGQIQISVQMADINFSFSGNQFIQLVVSDTGIGIEQADQTKLFQVFGQVDSSPTRKHGGTGLGLTLSRKIAESLGGKLELQFSEKGHGSSFLVLLPLKPPKTTS